MIDMTLPLLLYLLIFSNVVSYGIGRENGIEFALRRIQEWKKRGLL